MSSNDKTADLLVATTRATKAEASATEAKPANQAAEKAPVAKKAPVKKAAKKKVQARKAAPRKASAPAKKAAPKTQKEELLATFSFGRRVWPD